MLIGVPKEIKNHEYRVAMTPDGVKELKAHGHDVWIQEDAGIAVGYDNYEYNRAGAQIVNTPEELYSQADLILKVKEPQKSEIALIRPGQTIFSYLHLAPEPKLTQGLLDAKCIGIAFETVTSPEGSLPLLAPMSAVAGRVGVQVGAHCLEKKQGGSGVLLGGVAGVVPGRVVILGGGIVGINAATIAVGMGAQVTIIDKSNRQLRYIESIFGTRVQTVYSTSASIAQHLCNADLVIGAVLIPGASAPKLVTKEMLKLMSPGSVIVDVAIDQGGCFETSRPTTHEKPTYVVDNIIHYCVTNIPSMVAKTSTQALENATLPFTLALADKGVQNALKEDPHLYNGLNVFYGKVTHKAVALSLGLPLDEPFIHIP